MAMKTYTEEQKTSALTKIAEIGVTKESKELSISATTLNSWKKVVATTEILVEKAAPFTEATKVEPAKQEKLIADNAALKAENATMKAEIAMLKKAIAELTK